MRGKFLSGVVALAIGAFPMVPPEHVHEVADSHGRPHFYAHRHLAPNHASAPQKGATTLEDHDAVVTIDAVIAQPAQQYQPAAVTACVFTLDDPAVIEVCVRVPLAQPIHGPPILFSSLRSPPSSALL